MNINETLAKEFSLAQWQIDNTVALIDDDKTIPFIARYRKEQTGALDDQILRETYDRLNYLRNLEKRKAEVLSSIEEQGKLTDEITRAIENAVTLVEVEDIYRPYKQKRRTRASVAKEKGLEPLALLILEQSEETDPVSAAAEYIDEEKGVACIEDALTGAADIIAEMVSDDAVLRKQLRFIVSRSGMLVSKAADENQKSVYENYYDYRESAGKIAGHRVLALNRGEKEEMLKITLELPEMFGEKACIARYVKNDSACAKLVYDACVDSFRRLILPSATRETRATLTDEANEGAIKVFAQNLRQLLMQPPIKNSTTLGLDPAYRTGCKIAVCDPTGKVLDTAVVYPTPPQSKTEEAEKKLVSLIKKYGVNTISIGNGTASRESESFVADMLSRLDSKVSYMVVSEAGASVYSASKLAAAEFPQFDVSLRSAVSIARRLQDPLSELVKIDPKAIGVGQYQHDMPQARLGEALSGVVEDCVNSVGADLNTASVSLLEHVAGINSAVAKNVVAYREENGAFTDRKQLLKVKGLGAKAYEQCAGFLRVAGGKNPLDNTSVHPESYAATEKLLAKYDISVKNFTPQVVATIPFPEDDVSLTALAEELELGVPTLKDIIKELKKPARDPRDELPAPLLRDGKVMEISDLSEGMVLTGTVRNVIDFGCFVDIGVHEDGLVHISQICDRFIKHPLEAVKVGEVVKVKVLSVDVQRKRISLTMKF